MVKETHPNKVDRLDSPITSVNYLYFPREDTRVVLISQRRPTKLAIGRLDVRITQSGF